MVSILVFCGHCSHSSSTQIQPNKEKYVFKDNWYHRWSLDRSFEVKIRLEFPQNRQLPPPSRHVGFSLVPSIFSHYATRTTRHGEQGITLFTIASAREFSVLLLFQSTSCTVESRFLKLPRKTEIGLKSRLYRLQCSTLISAGRKKALGKMSLFLAVVVSLRGVNFLFWSRLGCSGQNVIIFSRQGLV